MRTKSANSTAKICYLQTAYTGSAPAQPCPGAQRTFRRPGLRAETRRLRSSGNRKAATRNPNQIFVGGASWRRSLSPGPTGFLHATRLCTTRRSRSARRRRRIPGRENATSLSSRDPLSDVRASKPCLQTISAPLHPAAPAEQPVSRPRSSAVFGGRPALSGQ